MNASETMQAPAGAFSAGRLAQALGPWLVALAVVVPTFMEVLDTTIANVALRYISGGLSAAASDSEWVITSYLAANAVILPITGWLATRLGRRRYLLLSIAIFTLASALCGMATSLGQLIFFRVLQGLAGGGLQPCSQGILIDTFPPEKQGAAQTLFGVAALIAPVLGPTLGGWITDEYSWRWIFLINLPVGVLAFFFCAAVVRDPAYLLEERAAAKRSGIPFDAMGLGLLILALVSWEIFLSKGQEWDWFGDPYGRLQTFAFLFVAGLGGLIWWEVRHPNPVVNFKPLKDRNFAIACLIIFCSFGVLYGSSTQLPGMLESVFGYDAFHAGLVLSPAGIFTILTILVTGRLLGLGADARKLIFSGLIILAIGNFWMSRVTLEASPSQLVWPRVVTVAGLGFVFAPINVAAYLYIPRTYRAAAVGLFALLRNEGGSVGTTLGKTINERREVLHGLRMNESLDPFNPAVTEFLAQAKAAFLQHTADPVAAQQMALEALHQVREQQALTLSYLDCFLVFSAIGVGLAFLVVFMRRSVVEKGTHVSAE